MNDVVICAEDIGKKYLIGHQSNERENYKTLRDMIGRSLKGLGQSALDLMRGHQIIAGDDIEEFWALRDVSFEIKRGEIVGVIGRNGAGKSTLLKVLSRITEPSTGRVTIKGRVASLLEVGTGFHRELTGRENIYLNGAILGMTRAEIKMKFDEIVAFAEVEKFLDTPVKRYSSGMYVRLAFAVAAHLEPEILIVDEVLAVGDVRFQRKCLGKMKEVAGLGRTVLFVSHNTYSVMSLCTRAIYMQSGSILTDGAVSQAVESHLGMGNATSHLQGKMLTVTVSADRVSLEDEVAYRLVFDVWLRGPLKAPRIRIGVNNSEGLRICTLLSETAGELPKVNKSDVRHVQISSDPIRFPPGPVYLNVVLQDPPSYKEAYENGMRVDIPHYTPFQHPPHVHPAGLIWSNVRIRTEFDRD